MSDFNRTRTLHQVKRMMKRKLACFPVERPRPGEPGSGKKPLTRRGFKDAVKDYKAFKALCSQYPEFNIGIATGEVSSVVVLDIDPRNGGHDTLEAFEKQHGKLPPTWTCRTGGGGTHIFFRAANFPIPKDNAGRLIGPGVDFLGEGAYAVAAPSLHESGQAYEWVDGLAPWECKLARLPRKIRRHIKAAIDKKAPKGKSKPVGEEPVTSVTEGTRNTTFFQKASRMRHIGMSEDEILDALTAINAKQGDPPLEPEEIAKIAASAGSYPAQPEGDTPDFPMRVVKRLLDQKFAQGDHLIYAPDHRFYVFVVTHWVEAGEAWIKSLLLEVLEGMPSNGRYASVLNDAMNLLKAKRAVTGDVFRQMEEPYPVITCLNGEVWLNERGAELRPHSPATFSRHCLPVVYDPAATCPTYDEALAGIFADAIDPDEMVRHWNEFFGYAIQPSRAYPIVVILLGGGANGKTKLVNTITRLMGRGLVYSGRIEELESNKFALGALRGKLLFVDDDVRTGIRLPDGTLKKISEEKELTGEQKYQNQFNFVSRAIPVLLCNNIPSLPDLSHGMLRRLQVLQFKRTFKGSKDDKGLFPRIWATEMSGVLNRAIEGWTRLQKRNRFRLPADAKAAQREWLIHANPLEGFLDEQCTQEPTATVLLADFYKAYTEWCKESGYNRVQQKSTVKRNLQNKGFETKKRNRGQTIIGLCLNRFSTI